jgi:hypothetical protein
MWVEEKGTSADPADITIACGCGKSRSLQELFQPGRLGNCRGERPWLVDRDPRFAQILEGALERSRICSNDPICADHQPDNRSGDRATHGAACHGCLLIAETSCEMRNLFLDRSLLVPTMGPDGSAFFRI